MSIGFGELRSVRTLGVFVGGMNVSTWKCFHAFALLQPLQAIHPRAAIDAAGIERADAFSKEHVVGTKVTTKVEDLHSTAVCAVHLHVGDHPPARSPELLRFALPCHFGSQRELLVDAFPSL